MGISDVTPLIIEVQSQSSWSEWVMAAFAFASAIGAISTAFVAFLAYWNDRSPKVVAYLRSNRDNSCVSFVVENIGKTCVYNIVVIGFDMGLADPKLRPFIEKSFISKGVSMLAPGQSRETVVCTKQHAFEYLADESREIEIRWIWRNIAGDKIQRGYFALDYYSFANSLYIKERESDVVVDED